MDSPTIRAAFCECMSQELGPFGFKTQKRPMSSRKVGSIRQAVNLAMVNHRSTHKPSLLLSLRVEEAEKIIFRFNNVGKLNDPERSTISIPLQNLADDPVQENFISSPEELAREIDQNRILLRQKAAPFFERYRALEEIEKGSNGPPECTINNMQHPHRGISGLALAYLMGNPHFEDLVRRYEDEMNGVEYDLAQYRRFVKFLRTKPAP